MKENDSQSPTHLLSGWKSADKDIKEHVIDIGEPAVSAVHVVAPITPVDDKNPAEKSAAEKSPAEKSPEAK